MNSVPYLRQSASAPGRNSSVGRLTPLPWIGSTMKAATCCDDSARSSAARSLKGIDVQSGSSGSKPSAEIRIVRQRQRAVGQAVEGVAAIDDAGTARGAARELDRRLDRLGAGIGEKHLVQIWHMFQQPLGQNAGERRHVDLHEIGQIGVEHALQRLAQRRMVAADRKHAEAAQQVEILVAGAVVEVLALALLEPDVIADGLQHADDLLVQMARMHGAALCLALREHLGNVKIRI